MQYMWFYVLTKEFTNKKKTKKKDEKESEWKRMVTGADHVFIFITLPV